MKKISTVFLMSFLIVFGISSSIYSQCKVKPIVKGNRPLLKPFLYDGYATNDINIGGKTDKVEVEFTAFGRQKYRLVFCTSGFAEKCTINVYDKSSKAKTRKKVFTSGDKGIDKTIWTVSPSKTTSFYVEYEVAPSADGALRKECVIMLIGYTEGTQAPGEDD